jgi:hypothetical protein
MRKYADNVMNVMRENAHIKKFNPNFEDLSRWVNFLKAQINVQLF